MFWRNWKRVGRLEDSVEMLERETRSVVNRVNELEVQVRRMSWRVTKLHAPAAASIDTDHGAWESTASTATAAASQVVPTISGGPHDVARDPISAALLKRRNRRVFHVDRQPPGTVIDDDKDE